MTPERLWVVWGRFAAFAAMIWVGHIVFFDTFSGGVWTGVIATIALIPSRN